MLNNALHRTLTATILWHELLIITLKNYRFKLNPCDFCAANVIIDDKQCAIAYHVGDMKLPCMDLKVAKEACSMLESKLGEMKIAHRKSYEFLGMKLTRQDDGCSETGAKSCLQTAIDEFCEETISTPMPACSNLLDADGSLPLADEDRKKLRYRLVCRSIFAAGRERKDLELVILLLSR